jgi:hypothetical protein
MGSQPQSVCLSPHDAFEWRGEPLEDMGGRGSKTKPNSPARATSRRAVSFRTDAVVGVDPMTECVDDLRLHDRASDDESLGHASATKVSKVQEILEGKVELKKNQQMLDHLPPSATPVATLELQFSSSEDSDENARSAKRKGSKKKTRKRRSVSERAAPSPSPSPVKLKLNELKVPKRPLAQQQQSQLASFVQDHFEQIKDAYALAEYSSKDTVDDSQTYRHRVHAPLQSQPSQPSSPQQRPRQEQQQSPSPRQYSLHKLKQQQQPGSSSPGKFLANPLDNWRISTNNSIQSIRSQIMEPRHPSRRSPPKSANHSTHSTKVRMDMNLCHCEKESHVCVFAASLLI